MVTGLLTVTVDENVAEPAGNKRVSPALAVLRALCSALADRLGTFMVAADATVTCKKHARRKYGRALRPGNRFIIEQHKANFVPRAAEFALFMSGT